MEIMAAIRARLTGDAQTAALLGARVYDSAPEKAVSPYMTIGSVGYTDHSTSSSDGQEFLFDLHCWDIPADRSNAKDTARVRNLMKHARRLFHFEPMPEAGCNVTVSQMKNAAPLFIDQDAVHGVVTLRVLAGHE